MYLKGMQRVGYCVKKVYVFMKGAKNDQLAANTPFIWIGVYVLKKGSNLPVASKRPEAKRTSEGLSPKGPRFWAARSRGCEAVLSTLTFHKILQNQNGCNSTLSSYIKSIKGHRRHLRRNLISPILLLYFYSYLFAGPPVRPHLIPSIS